MLVVAITIAPAFFAKETHSASSFEIVLFRAINPNVWSLPSTAVLSFVVNGTPRKGLAANSSEQYICTLLVFQKRKNESKTIHTL